MGKCILCVVTRVVRLVVDLVIAHLTLQQVPARDPILGPLVRGLFLPEEDHVWGAYDYSQQEPRLTVHYASTMNLPGSDEAVSAYRHDDADFPSNRC